MTTDKPCRCGPDGCADSECPGHSDYQRLMDKHNNLHLNAHELRAERDRLAAEVDQLAQYTDALNERCIADTARIGELAAEVERLRSESAANFSRAREWAERCGAAQAEVERLRVVLERADRLVAGADWRLGGVLSAESRASEIPSKAYSQVKARHLASLRDAVRAAKDGDDSEVSRLRADAERTIRELEAHRLYARALCKAVDAATDFAGTVAGGAAWWDEVWADHAAALDRARDRITDAAMTGEGGA